MASRKTSFIRYRYNKYRDLKQSEQTNNSGQRRVKRAELKEAQIMQDIQKMIEMLKADKKYGPYEMDTVDGKYYVNESGEVQFTPW